MRIHRFSACRYGNIKAYGYIVANLFERRHLRKRIAAGDTGLREVEDWMTGPRTYGAQFIITAKRKKGRA